ncbi:hypothetical protein HanPSC8_Chr01g0026471 [Helianthus annuus]|nr:hypothetical protein HanPSC8_Chr01g0026471 [Helianthus annuus]
MVKPSVSVMSTHSPGSSHIDGSLDTAQMFIITRVPDGWDIVTM